MRKTLLIIAVLMMAVAGMNAQKKEKKQGPNYSVDGTYQVVNVTKEASVCFDTLTKRFDMVCYVRQDGQTKAQQIVLGTEFPEIAASLMASIDKYNVTRRTVDYVLKYFVLYRDMPMEGYSFSVDYCTDYSLKLNLYVSEYNIDKIPVTFALADINKDGFKTLVPFSKGGALTKSDLEIVRNMIENKIVKIDAETEFFMTVAFPDKGEKEEAVKGEKGKKDKADKPKDGKKDKADKPKDGKKDKADKSKDGKKDKADKSKDGKKDKADKSKDDKKDKADKPKEEKPQEAKPEEKPEDEGGKVVDDDQWKLY